MEGRKRKREEDCVRERKLCRESKMIENRWKEGRNEGGVERREGNRKARKERKWNGV